MGEIYTTITEQFTNLSPGKRKFIVQVEHRGEDIRPTQVKLFELDEKYEVIEVLGYGGFGTVCMARDTSNNERVAIKRIDLNGGRYYFMALRELQVHRAVTRISHPFIVTLKGVMRPVDIDNFNEIYIVMDMVECNLRTLLKSQAAEIEENCAEVYLDTKVIMYQLLKGLQYLHDANVLHRDLKPANILFDFDTTRAKLCDFGLARRRAPEMTTFVATAPFRAPELFLKDDPENDYSSYGSAIDVWSLGCIFAELLCPNPLALSHLFDVYEYELSAIHTIVQTIPPPDDDEIGDITDDPIVAEFIRNLPRQPSRPLEQIFERLADRNALDLLQKMLTFNPAKRITITQALEHEFMREITVDVISRELNLRPSEVEMLTNPPTISVDLQSESPDPESNKRMLFDACMNFHG